ncbi:hypothetical protein LZ554_005709 [Drepanopeziza brunnea f. sp. 'monogermtubi']|nr:hypothetical protein LZ554_005709 [Drepanopeziza brunnea f. sp. 'monogermtubi']
MKEDQRTIQTTPYYPLRELSKSAEPTNFTAGIPRYLLRLEPGWFSAYVVNAQEASFLDFGLFRARLIRLPFHGPDYPGATRASTNQLIIIQPQKVFSIQ